MISKIKIIVVMVIAFAFAMFAASAYAQTPTPAPKPPDPLEGAWNVSINGGYSSLSNSQTNNGFVTGVSFRVAQHWNLRSDVYILNNPSVTVALAGPEYRFSLEHLLKGNPQFAANASRVEAFINLGAGTVRSTDTVVGTNESTTTTEYKAKFAYSAGGGFDIKLSDTVSLRPLDLKYIRGSMLAGGGQVIGNHLQFAAGLGVRF